MFTRNYLYFPKRFALKQKVFYKCKTMLTNLKKSRFLCEKGNVLTANPVRGYLIFLLYVFYLYHTKKNLHNIHACDHFK